MENSEPIPTLTDRLELLRRRWVYPTIITPACILIAVFLAFALTPLYRSTGTIILDTFETQKEVAQPVMSYTDQQFELVQRRLMTRSNLVELVKKVDPYPGRPDLSLADKAEMVGDNTTVERVDPVTFKTLAQSNAFSLSYDNPDPQRAQAVAREIVNMFLVSNQKTRQERAGDTYRFLLQQSEQLRTSIRGMEARLADFKTKYGDALPDMQARNQQELDRAQQNYDSLQAQIRLAQEKESLLSVQLSQISPTLLGAATDTRTQLAQLQAELADDEQRYTPAHPDIRRLKRAIHDLVAQEKAGGPGSTVKPDNPEYLTTQSQLESARVDLAALRAEATRADTRMNSYTHRLQLTPDVERQYSQLNRDYQIAGDQFREIQGKLKDASLTKSLVADDQGDRFTLIRKPGMSSQPSSPNRLGIILIGIVLGIALGIGAAVFVEIGDGSVRGARDLQELTGQSMLSAVPVLLNHADKRARRRRVGAVATAFGIAVAIVSLTVVRAIS